MQTSAAAAGRAPSDREIAPAPRHAACSQIRVTSDLKGSDATMSPITHFMVGWVALERFQASNRDKALVVCAGLAPDLDGLGIVVDFATRTLGLPETDYYQSFHRMYGHGLPAAVLLSALVGMCGVNKIRVALCTFISIHLHLLCDLLGSRGAGAEDIWGVFYLSPLNQAFELSWHGQWPLIGWQNLLITAT